MTDDYIDISLMLTRNAKAFPDKAAIFIDDGSTTWRDFDCRVSQVANALQQIGIDHGDKVGILASPSPSAVEVFFGAIRAGACAVPFSDMNDAGTLERMVNDADTKVLFLSDSMRDLVGDFAVRSSKLIPGGRIGLDFEAEGWTPLEELLAHTPATPPQAVIAPDDAFNIIYSSGTTGRPKGIVHSHRMRSFQIARMGAHGFSPDSITLIATPLYSNTTLVTLLPSLAFGGTVVLMPKFEAQEFLRVSEKYKVTHTMLVPVQFQRILDSIEFDLFDLSAYQVKLSTGSPFPSALKQDALDRWPGRLVELYGVTEGGCTTVLDAGAHPNKLDSVGRPAPGVEIRILDAQGRELPQGETGEIAGRAVSMMSGYFKQPALTEEITWRDREGNAFYKTGDLGYVDGDGFLHLKGRTRDIIISGGMNIYASDLEQVLLQHPGVSEAAVIGIPSRRWGETPLAIVVLKPGIFVEPEELLFWTNQRLGKAQRLYGIRIQPNLPRNALGKVDKRELKRSHRENGQPSEGA
ncbi:class I adenylate-forming enzyme family protein [Acidobacteriota bacterium]